MDYKIIKCRLADGTEFINLRDCQNHIVHTIKNPFNDPEFVASFEALAAKYSYTKNKEENE